MVDYTRATGSAGSLIIRDNGTTVTFLLYNGSSLTHSDKESWSGTVNGVRVGGSFAVDGVGTITLGGPWPVAKSQTVSLTLNATNTQGLGGPTTFSQAISRPLPNAPTGLTITRTSDTQHSLAWSRQSTYTSVLVQRRENDGAWVQVASIAGNAASYIDRSTVANRKYVYRVAGVAASGQSAWSGSAVVYTTPTPPFIVTATRSGNSIVVGVQGYPSYATSYDVRDGATVVATSVSVPWTHASPDPAVPHTYTVRSKNGSLVSAWSTPSNTVQLLSAPNAPTSLAPNGKTLGDAQTVRFAWAHNPVDASPQSAYELNYRAVGASSWTTLTGTTAMFRDQLLTVGAWEWQVRTKGAHASFSPWSATAQVTVIDRPGVAVLSPDGSWDKSTVTVGWSWFQAQGRPQSAWEAVLLNAAGDVVETRGGSGADVSAVFQTRVAEGAWSVQVRAATGGVWSEWATEPFTVVFVPPTTPEIVGFWDETAGHAQLTVTILGVPTSGQAIRYTVERSVDGGEVWEPVADSGTLTWMFVPGQPTAPIVNTLVDAEGMSYGDTVYRVTAYTVQGASSSAQVVVEARSAALWLTGGPGFGITGRLPFDPSVQITAGRERALKQYAGRSKPVAVHGEALSRVVAVSGTTLDRDEETADVHKLTELAHADAALFLFRDPDGTRIYGMVPEIQTPRQTSHITDDGWQGVWGYSFTLTEAT